MEPEPELNACIRSRQYGVRAEAEGEDGLHTSSPQASLVPTSRSLRTKLDLRTCVLACLPLFYRNQVFSFT